MFYPNQHFERKFKRKGYAIIAGLDEAGRGAWAGPIVAAAVVLPTAGRIYGIRDSKKLRSPQRNAMFEKIAARASAWAVGVVSETEIDQIGIGPANQKAMLLAVQNLTIEPNFLLIDALRVDSEIPNQAIVKGDHKVTSIAAASIIAKVWRDRIMDVYSEQYPQYGFSHHKGYGTNHHHHMLMEYGPCPIHRKTFEPINFILELRKQ